MHCSRLQGLNGSAGPLPTARYIIRPRACSVPTSVDGLHFVLRQRPSAAPLIRFSTMGQQFDQVGKVGIQLASAGGGAPSGRPCNYWNRWTSPSPHHLLGTQLCREKKKAGGSLVGWFVCSRHLHRAERNESFCVLRSAAESSCRSVHSGTFPQAAASCWILALPYPPTYLRHSICFLRPPPLPSRRFDSRPKAPNLYGLDRPGKELCHLRDACANGAPGHRLTRKSAARKLSVLVDAAAPSSLVCNLWSAMPSSPLPSLDHRRAVPSR